MTLELKFNDKHETLDLIGRLPAGAERKVTQFMTYNPTLRCYQGTVSLQVLKLAYDLHATISPDLAEVFQDSIDTVRKRAEREKTSAAPPKSEKREGTGPIGFMVKHASLGIGRLLKLERDVATVRFFFPRSLLKLKYGFINRTVIPIGTPCMSEKGNCIIREITTRKEDGFYIYGVEFENGLFGQMSETELAPIQLIKPQDPLDVLATLQHEGYPLFKGREEFSEAYNALVRRGIGVKSLLSSRIDLHPHQAYVAGTVILDSKQRYLLTDEVGLGKTIEAGIIIHDILARNPRARILILCPGSLVQQWFSEMYSKFSGVIFRLPELSNINLLITEETQQVILSFSTAQTYQEELTSQKWELVVIDEVHHLLRVRCLYELAKELSLQNCGLLLLSALPAQHRDQEYYDLLALLEPRQYKQDDTVAREHFSKLFERQREIGGRIGVVNRRLSEFHEGESKPDRVIKQLTTLMEMPILKDDQFLKESIGSLNSGSESFTDDVHQIVHHISDYYRINRRILRNRREKLIQSDQLELIQRYQNSSFYNPDQYELDALTSLERLLQSIRQTELREEILLPLTQQLFQSATHPATLLRTLRNSEQALPPELLIEEYEELHDLVSYLEWDDQIKYLWSNAMEAVDHELLQESILSAEAWEKQEETENLRLQRLISLLKEKHKTQSKDKFILFAGYPKLASILAKQLSDRFGQASIARFYFGLHNDPILERDLKEKEVRRFKIDQQTWLLVCDETGGEGRNFQFASELFHYDLPWQVAKIEQRIGRLDRLGRKHTEVISNLIIPKGSKEEAWLACLSEGLGVFNQSISGLEFGLRDIELAVTRSLFSDDDQALWNMPPYIKERVAEERALDESRNQMDEASYERIRAENFRRVQSNQAQDRKLEKTFTWYFKLISDRGGVRFLNQVDYAEGIIEFHPEDVRYVQLDLSDNKKERVGTFHREIAQNRPDLEFFSVGNDFFDSVCRSLSTDPTGRTYAVECKADQPTWRGFEFSYRLKPANQLAGQDFGHQNLLDHLFAERIEHSFVDEKGAVVDPPGAYLRLRRSFDKQNKGSVWKNITKEKVTFLSNRYPNWDEMLRSAEAATRSHVRKRYAQMLGPKIEEHLKAIDEQVRKLKAAKPDGWEDQAQAFNQLKEALSTWDLELDIAGFLSINGGILGA